MKIGVKIEVGEVPLIWPWALLHPSTESRNFGDCYLDFGVQGFGV